MLETIADAAGYSLRFHFPDKKRPDVLRLHLDRTGLFLGESKHTEGPFDLCSVDRLRVYLDCLLPLIKRDIRGLLAIAHPIGLERPWRDQLDWLCQDTPISGAVGSNNITSTTTVTFVRLICG